MHTHKVRGIGIFGEHRKSTVTTLAKDWHSPYTFSSLVNCLVEERLMIWGLGNFIGATKSLLVNGRTSCLCTAWPASSALLVGRCISAQQDCPGGFLVMAAACTGNWNGTNWRNVKSVAQGRVAELKSKMGASVICLLCRMNYVFSSLPSLTNSESWPWC